MAERERVLGGRYRLLRPLGTGGMGSVWSAEDLVLGRTVALKELAHHLNGGRDLEARRARALREARALAQAVDPAIVQIYDVLVERGDPWLVMQYIPGPSLADLVASGPPDERTVARIGLRVLRALRAAHAANVLHRDVKPANILLDDTGRAYLVDFGIARITGATALTADNTVLGTLEFMAPERIRGDAIGPPSDLWSLGVTLYFALEGRSPFRASNDTAAATIWAIMNSPAPRPATPGPLAEAVTRLLEKDPTHRMRAEHLERALRETLTPHRPPTPNRADEPRADDHAAPAPPETPRPKARRDRGPALDPRAEPRADDRATPDSFKAGRPEQRGDRRPAPRERGERRDRDAGDPDGAGRPGLRDVRRPAPGGESRADDFTAPDPYAGERSEGRGERGRSRGEARGDGRGASGPFADGRSERRGAGRRGRSGGRGGGPSGRVPSGEARGGEPVPAARVAPGLARQVRELSAERAAELLAGYAPADVRDVLAELGRAAGPILLVMPREAAAQVVASARARSAAAFLDVMAVAPHRAAPVVQILSTTMAARAFGYMSTPGAIALIAALPARDAARVLAATDLRAAAGVLAALPPETAAPLVDALPVRRACDVLGYVPPATVAALLRAASHPDLLLSELSGPVRTQVLRHL
ncbi:Serine/threonine-protein kinase PrkC [Actinomadura rubteroloni]|uniref:non-specific serine/threonine protein kinase n=1 Tax=Actinomadura rubteroloni TaxID=1926885 RepID=A0A2P4UQ50_9ACTN|nr:protein kinase [Actinomadura rubteroloni]POM27177.1 Serine/threonine-protein kinase PrkC [Actinomadura rubteroloni]